MLIFRPDLFATIPILEILAETEEGDAYLFASKDKRIAFVTGHPEYDANTPQVNISAMWKPV